MELKWVNKKEPTYGIKCKVGKFSFIISHAANIVSSQCCGNNIILEDIDFDSFIKGIIIDSDATHKSHKKYDYQTTRDTSRFVLNVTPGGRGVDSKKLKKELGQHLDKVDWQLVYNMFIDGYIKYSIPEVIRHYDMIVKINESYISKLNDLLCKLKETRK